MGRPCLYFLRDKIYSKMTRGGANSFFQRARAAPNIYDRAASSVGGAVRTVQQHTEECSFVGCWICRKLVYAFHVLREHRVRSTRDSPGRPPFSKERGPSNTQTRTKSCVPHQGTGDSRRVIQQSGGCPNLTAAARQRVYCTVLFLGIVLKGYR